MRAEQKQAVANTGTPRKVISWVKAYMGSLLNARLHQAVAAATIAAARKTTFSAEDRAAYALWFRNKHRYGRFTKRNWHSSESRQGEREIARRHRQIVNGKLSPVYRVEALKQAA